MRSRGSSTATTALLRDFRRTRDPRVRDRLILTLAPVVKHIVDQKIGQLASRSDAEDFVSAGLEALIRAVDRFDPNRGMKLETFVWSRVQGAVVDELRRQHWEPRSVRHAEMRARKAYDGFVSRTGREPTARETAGHLGLTREGLHTHRLDVLMAELASLDVLVRWGHGAAVHRVDTIADRHRDNDPEPAAEREDTAHRVRRAIGGLDAREQTIARLLYVQQLTLGEVGTAVGLSGGRVCQIHRELRRKLRDELGARDELFQSGD